MSTLICDSKQFKKAASILSKLDTIKNIIYFEEDGESNDSGISGDMGNVKAISFHDVEKLGKDFPSDPRLPKKDDIAVVMYTSGSTGLPKVCATGKKPIRFHSQIDSLTIICLLHKKISLVLNR